MPTDKMIKALLAVAISVTAILFILITVVDHEVILNYGPLFAALFIVLALILGFPFYILLLSARRRLKKDESDGIRTAYLRSCAAGIVVVFLVSGRVLWAAQNPECTNFFDLVTCGIDEATVVLLLLTPLKSAVIMYATFRLVLLRPRGAETPDLPGQAGE